MAVLQRVQVGALLDLENLLYTARRSSGAVGRPRSIALRAAAHEVIELPLPQIHVSAA